MEEKVIKGLVELIMKEVLNFERSTVKSVAIARRHNNIAKFVGENFGEGADYVKLKNDIDNFSCGVWFECKERMDKEASRAELYYLQNMDKDYAVQGHKTPKTLERKAKAYGRKCGLADFKRVLPIAAYKYVSDFLYDYYRNECKMF